MPGNQQIQKDDARNSAKRPNSLVFDDKNSRKKACHSSKHTEMYAF